MEKNNILTIPLAIIIAGIIIAGAVLLSGSSQPTTGTVQAEPHTIAAAEISDSDHILGNRNASIKIVEYSDTECPFCKRFHETLHNVVEGENAIEDVAWVYRHYPIEGLHATAIRQSEATECVARIAGEESFWNYLDSIYATTESNDGLPDEQLFILAENIGVNSDELRSCLDSGEMTQKIQEAIAAADEAGARGTPYSVLFLDSELSDEQISNIRNLDLEITNHHPTQRVLRVDEVEKNKVSMSGALPQELIEILIEIIRG